MLREVAGDQPLGRAFLKQMKSPLLLFLPRTASTLSRGSSIMPGAVVACCQHGWVSDDGRQQVVLSGASRGSPAQLGTASLPLQSYYLGVGDADSSSGLPLPAPHLTFIRSRFLDSFVFTSPAMAAAALPVGRAGSPRSRSAAAAHAGGGEAGGGGGGAAPPSAFRAGCWQRGVAAGPNP